MPDLNANDLDAASKIIAGTARSMGVDVEGLSCMSHGKRYRAAYEQIDRNRQYAPAEAVGLLKQTAGAKFDETVEVHFKLGLNVRHAEEQLRGTLALPNGLGKSVTVAVFAEGEAARAAEEAGADHVGAQDLAEEGRGGLHGLRRRDRDAGPDGPGRLEARPRPRPPGQDAEPEGRHRHRRRRQGRRRGQGRQGRVPHRPPGQRPPHHRQGELRRAARCSRTTPRSSTRSSAPSRPRPRAATSSRSRWRPTMGPGIRVDPRPARPRSRRGRSARGGSGARTRPPSSRARA